MFESYLDIAGNSLFLSAQASCTTLSKEQAQDLLKSSREHPLEKL